MPRTTEIQARQRIEAAALKLFARKPFSSVRLDEIAAEANASLQTIYRYYGDKPGLLEVCMDDWLGQLARRMLDHLQGIESFKDRLRKVFWVVIDFFERNPEVISMMANAVTPAMWQQTATFRQRALSRELIQMFAQGRAQGILNDEVSEAILLDYFYGVLFRIVPMNLARGRPEALSPQANVLFEMLWRAISKPQKNV